MSRSTPTGRLVSAIAVRLPCWIGVGLAACLLSGCLQTSMLPARQIDRGEVVASGGLHVPTLLYAPSVMGQATAGLGGGDLTANVGGSAFGLSAGAGGRLYLSPSTNLEAQSRLTVDGETPRWLATVGLQDVPRANEPFYYGAHVGGIGGKPLEFDQPQPRTSYPVAGITVGLGHIDLGDAWFMQVELEANLPFGGDEGPLPPGGVSVGVFRYPE